MVRIPSFLSMEQFERRLEQPWTFFGLTALTVLMVAIDSTIVAVALPTLVRDPDTTLVLAAWTITAYALAQTVMLPMAGQLAEQFGQMRVFVACVSLFTVGSLLCALAPNVYALIACRIVQAIGGGGLFPAATGLVAQKPPQTRSRMIGLIASIFPIGGILGPNLGGLVIEQFGWRQTFIINVPLGIIVVGLLARQALAQAPARQTTKRTIDVLGPALFAVSIASFMVALTLALHHGLERARDGHAATRLTSTPSRSAPRPRSPPPARQYRPRAPPAPSSDARAGPAGRGKPSFRPVPTRRRESLT
ncbi:MAG TPA: MFS transporter [Chloroflexota bacterium]|nr:MFS transporter [Chloroflexota bacterium]